MKHIVYIAIHNHEAEMKAKTISRGSGIKVGDLYSFWTVVQETESKLFGIKTKVPSRMFLCRCRCGVEKIIAGSNLRSGHSKSCGCRPKPTKYKKKYQFDSIPHSTVEVLMHRYDHMLRRCYNPDATSYHRYGGRGIKVCNNWRKDFRRFAMWAFDNGFDPSLQLDRINNDGWYSPENCRWVSPTENIRNSTVTKIKAVDALAIRRLVEMGLRMRVVANMFGIDISQVSKINSGKSWRTIDIADLSPYIPEATDH